MPEATPTSYDEVPYESHPYGNSHPDRLALVATLLGMQPAPVDRCRVLELGCSSGGNLIPMAQDLPESSFVGVELSRRQVENGRKVIAAVGLGNIALEHRNILDVGPDLGGFDYIISHGVYSWVPPDVQDKILSICAENLAPNGVAYVSYNVYPGWHVRGMIRDMMCYHVRQFSDPRQRAAEARGMIDFLAKSAASERTAHAAALQEELEMIRQQGDWYLLHDHLEDVNLPVYFHEFAGRIAAKGLQYVGEAETSTMVTHNFSPEVQSTLGNLSLGVIEMEQYMDFLRNRKFRSTLLCHAGIALNRMVAPERLFHFHAASQNQPVSNPPDLRPSVTEEFKGPGDRTISTSRPITKAALACLWDIWPQTMPFETLLSESLARLGGRMSAEPSEAATSAAVLAVDLAEGYVRQVVELHAHARRFVLTVSERPTASPLVRYQTETGAAWVTSLRHEAIRIDEAGRFILRHLDGTRDRSALLAALRECVARGELKLEENGQPVENEDRLLVALNGILDRALPGFARLALLTG